MNRQDRAILVGMALGDGYIRTASAADKRAGRRISPQLVMAHSVKQSAYLHHKLDALNKMFGGQATVSYRRDQGHSWCYAAKSNPYFRTLKRMMYDDGKKRITPRVLSMLSPRGVAYWFMDDGSYRINQRSDGTVSSVSLNISTYCSRPEVDAIISYFSNTHGVQFKPAYCKRTELWYVRTNTANARALAGMIGKHVIPSMQYKLSCVEMLDCHERPAPDKQCVSCEKQFAALKASGLCMGCYNDAYYAKRELTTRDCEVCEQTKPENRFVGTRCRTCYQRQRRSGDEIV